MIHGMPIHHMSMHLHSTANAAEGFGIVSHRHPLKAAARTFSVPIESERRLCLFILTRFLHANRYPFRWKKLQSDIRPLDDIAEPVPALAFPALQLHLPQRMVVGGTGVDADAG
jgi:hypothetical protein